MTGKSQFLKVQGKWNSLSKPHVIMPSFLDTYSYKRILPVQNITVAPDGAVHKGQCVESICLTIKI